MMYIGGSFDDFLRDPLRIIMPSSGTREALAEMSDIAMPYLQMAMAPGAGSGMGWQFSGTGQPTGTNPSIPGGFASAPPGYLPPGALPYREPTDPAPLVIAGGIGVAVLATWLIAKAFMKG